MKTGTWIDTLPAEKIAKAVARLRGVDRKLADNVSVDPDTDGEFCLWMVLTDIRFGKIAGMSIMDMEDYGWSDAYSNGDSPREALTDAMEAWNMFV